jgi:hypothetical protein
MIQDLMKRLETVVHFLPPIPVVMTELLTALDDEDADMNSWPG